MSNVQGGGERADRRQTKDELIVAALVGGCSYREAAAKARVGLRTVERRMESEEFRGRVRAGRAERVSAVDGGLLEMGPDYLEAIRDCVRPGMHPRERLRAAALGLGLVVKLAHVQELEADVAELKRELAELRALLRGKGTAK